MDGPEKHAHGPRDDGLWFAPEERLAILTRAYPVTWRRMLRHVLPEALAIVRTCIMVALAPVALALHACLRLVGCNGIAHVKPAGHGIMWATNVHSFKRARHGPCKDS